jgi:hypothetical protein
VGTAGKGLLFPLPCFERELDGWLWSPDEDVDLDEAGGGGLDKARSEREDCKLCGQLLISAKDALMPPDLEGSLSAAVESSPLPSLSFVGLVLPKKLRNPTLDSRLASLSERESGRSGTLFSSPMKMLGGRARRILLDRDWRDSNAPIVGLNRPCSMFSSTMTTCAAGDR